MRFALTIALAAVLGAAVPALARDKPPLRDLRCEIPPERGACKAHLPAFAYDPASRTCKPFVWGGCGPAPFGKRDECEAVCTYR